ncbi:MAG: MmgE/PrpD family protein [Alcaligenaceae bacterium]|nr:MmgE/PrpD family protein [Alcaligenaceae bacterium SAGV5]MPS50754.1 MmgE/PrpD family protein [Alcaligenaceae bacterium SAGV3]MPT57092.1 MmgE/PrpD family protein [Alcaligenaceae bacterium]
MDTSISRLADFAAGLRFEHLDASVAHDCKRRLIDALGCGVAAFDAPPSRIARKLAARVELPDGAPVLGTARRTLPELAAFANGVMIRYLDGNDTFPGGGGHPSDVMAAVLAAAQEAKADGRATITAIVAAYEVYAALFRAVNMRERGLDHVFYTAVAGAAGACNVMGLDAARTAQAIALAVTPNLALEATRRGALSEWKGCAAGNAARNGLFAALLAREGLTGPEQAIDGAHGLRELVGRFDLPELTARGAGFRIGQAHLKRFLAEFHAQSPITAALELARKVSHADIARIILHTYHFAWSEVGHEPEKWRPTTRETADHSLPYMISATLIDGDFSDAVFEPARLADERIHALASRLAVEEDPELSARFPAFVPCRLEIVTHGGERHVATVDYPRGHAANPMDDAEVEEKFLRLAGRHLDEAGARRALDILWRLDASETLEELWSVLTIGVEERP